MKNRGALKLEWTQKKSFFADYSAKRVLIVSTILLCMVIFRWGFLFVSKSVVVAMNVIVFILCVGIYFKVGRFARIVMLVFFVCWLLTVAQVVILCFYNPRITPMMIIQSRKHPEYKSQRLDSYVKLEQVSPYLIHAADIGEDLGIFMYHRGFNVNAMVNCYISNEAGNPLRGASTISQQTVKNCFLTPSRTILRKLVEAHYTVLIELFWGKQRIMERYLNIVEFGCGIYGCEAASQYYFCHSVSQLTPSEAAMLVASLPSPCQSNPNHVTPKFNQRFNHILELMEKNPTTKIDSKRKDLDSELLIQHGRSTWFFCKWVIRHEIIQLFGMNQPRENDTDEESKSSYVASP